MLPTDSPARPDIRHTERTMLDLLHQRYDKNAGNGPRYAVAEHVKEATGWYGTGPAGYTRCADFMALELWPSSGLPLHGHEVKVSRSDWLHELADPTKAEAFTPYCDYWWLVVSDKTIVRPGELPAGWGLLTATPRGLRAAIPAARRAPEPLPRPMLASFTRAIAKTASRRAVA